MDPWEGILNITASHHDPQRFHVFRILLSSVSTHERVRIWRNTLYTSLEVDWGNYQDGLLRRNSPYTNYWDKRYSELRRQFPTYYFSLFIVRDYCLLFNFFCLTLLSFLFRVTIAYLHFQSVQLITWTPIRAHRPTINVMPSLLHVYDLTRAFSVVFVLFCRWYEDGTHFVFFLQKCLSRILSALLSLWLLWAFLFFGVLRPSQIL